MAKPSIFSKDYDRLMKKRRRKVYTIIVFCILISTLSAIYIINGGINFSEVKSRLQAWVDSGKEIEDDNDQSIDPIQEEKSEEVEPQIEIFETNIGENAIKVSLEIDKNGNEFFNEVIEGDITISPNKTQLLTMDSNQNIFLINVNKDINDITKKDYASTTGDIYSKDLILQQYQGYVWHKTPRFIDENKIVYISNLPYFSKASSEYLWIYDKENQQHRTIWSTKGNQINLGAISEKGLEINIDGKIKYVTTNGDLID